MKKLQMLHSFTLTALHDKRHYKVVRPFIMCKINVCVCVYVKTKNSFFFLFCVQQKKQL